MSRHSITVGLLAAALCGCQSSEAQSNDPPGRVGRVSDMTGSVSFRPVGDSDWSSASLNYPLTSGDAVWADVDARAEFHLGSSAVHIAPGTALDFDAIEDNLTQLYVGKGSVFIRLRTLSEDESYEIDTPAGDILLRTGGRYRIDVTPDGRRTTVTVRDGDADVMIGNNSYPVRQGTSVTLLGGGSRPSVNDRPMAQDDWERWGDSRNRRGDNGTATRYVSNDMVGYEDLDAYGDWQVDASYGPVWYPRSVSSGWAPYRNGRWVSVQPWGWTWVDESPWGFAPFHYGRWSYQRGRWGWIPGTIRARPVYAPALVAFVSGSSWGVSLSFGSGGGVGWIPLGPNEVYVPSYRHTPTYIRNVNITNVNVTRVDVTQINITNVTYVNRSVPGAVTAVPRDAFMGSQRVASAAVTVRPSDLTTTRVSSAPIVAGVAVAPPPRGSPMDRARPENSGTIRRPPPEAPRAAPAPRRQGAKGREAIPVTPDRGRGDNGVTPPVVTQPAVPPATPDRGRGRGRDQQTPPPPPAAVPAPVVPTPPPSRGGNRGGGRDVPTATTPPVPATPPAPTPATPDRNRGRGRDRQTQPTPTPAAPTSAVIPTPVPVTPTPAPDAGRGRNRPTQAQPTPPAATPAVPAPVTTTPPTNQDRGRGRQSQPTPTPVVPTPAKPSDGQTAGRSGGQTGGRGKATVPDSGKKGKADSGKKGG